MLNEYGADLTTTNNNYEDMQGLSTINIPQHMKPEGSSKRLVTSEVQTDLDSNTKLVQTTKVYKEITIQTDPVIIKSIPSGYHDDNKSDNSLSKKSSTTTERRDK